MERAIRLGLVTAEELDRLGDGPQRGLDRSVEAGILLPHQAAFLRKAVPRAADLPVPTADVRIRGFDGLVPIGRGATATVYRAVRAGSGEVVALKLFDTEAALNRAETEQNIAWQTAQPSLVKVLERGEHEGRPYLVMELIDGEDLAARIARSAGPSPLVWAVELIRDVARGVGELHRQGLVHKDLKPANIILDRLDNPHVADLGLAAHRSDSARYLEKGGTIGYAAPEWAQPDIPLGPQADVYSLCAMLAELLGGRPSGGDSAPSANAVNLPLRIPGALLSILQCGLEPDPADRLADGHELAEQLDRFLRGEPIAARTPSPVRRLSAWMLGHPGWTRTIAVSLLALALTSAGSLQSLVVPAVQRVPWLEQHVPITTWQYNRYSEEVLSLLVEQDKLNQQLASLSAQYSTPRENRLAGSVTGNRGLRARARRLAVRLAGIRPDHQELASLHAIVLQRSDTLIGAAEAAGSEDHELLAEKVFRSNLLASDYVIGRLTCLKKHGLGNARQIAKELRSQIERRAFIRFSHRAERHVTAMAALEKELLEGFRHEAFRPTKGQVRRAKQFEELVQKIDAPSQELRVLRAILLDRSRYLAASAVALQRGNAGEGGVLLLMQGSQKGLEFALGKLELMRKLGLLEASGDGK